MGIIVGPPTEDTHPSSLQLFFRRAPQQCYVRTAALRLILQPCDEDEEKDYQFFSFFSSNEIPVE
jgi:hypothetical protein